MKSGEVTSVIPRIKENIEGLNGNRGMISASPLRKLRKYSKLRKKLSSKNPAVTGSLRKPDGSWMKKDSECLDLLNDTHFIGCIDVSHLTTEAVWILNEETRDPECDEKNAELIRIL